MELPMATGGQQVHNGAYSDIGSSLHSLHLQLNCGSRVHVLILCLSLFNHVLRSERSRIVLWRNGPVHGRSGVGRIAIVLTYETGPEFQARKLTFAAPKGNPSCQNILSIWIFHDIP